MIETDYNVGRVKKYSLSAFIVSFFLASGGFLLSALPVAAASLTLTAPIGGECLKGGAAQNITWNASGIDHVGIQYQTDGHYPIPYNYNVTSSGSGNSFLWNVPKVNTTSARLYLDGMDNHDVILAPVVSSGSFSIDSSPPGAPSLAITNKTSTSVSLSWTAASDLGCKGLVGYQVYRGENLVATVGAGSTTYTDSALSGSTTYNYKVTAFDDFATASSSSVQATTAAAPAPTPTPKPTPAPTPIPTPTPGISQGGVTNLKTTLLTVNSIKVTWETSTATVGVIDFGLTDKYGQSFTGDGYRTTHAVTISDLAANKTYHYKVRSKEKSGKETLTDDLTFDTSFTPLPKPTPKPTPTPTPTPIPVPVKPALHKLAVDGSVYEAVEIARSRLKVGIGKPIHLEGTAGVDAVLQLAVYSQKSTVQVKADSKGVWQYDVLTKTLPKGEHKVTLALVSGGVVGPEADIVTFNLVASTQPVASLNPGVRKVSATTNRANLYLPVFILLALIGLAIMEKIRKAGLARSTSSPSNSALKRKKK